MHLIGAEVLEAKFIDELACLFTYRQAYFSFVFPYLYKIFLYQKARVNRRM